MIRIFIGVGNYTARRVRDGGGVSRYDSRAFIAMSMHRSAKQPPFIFTGFDTNWATTPRCACALATARS
jgi:hypothetical protein